MTKADRKARAEAVAAWLKTTFPALFATHPPLPLAIGVHTEIQRLHPEVNRAALATALHWHGHSPTYLRSLAAPGAQRHDLQGNPMGPVSAEQQADAKARLAEWQAATEAARRASRKAHTARQGKPQGYNSKPPDTVPPARAETAPETPRLRPLLSLKGRIKL